MALRPPRHRIDATARFVSFFDSEAWDERLDAELREAESDPDLDVDDHPQRRYTRGETRFDMSAPMRWKGEDVRISDYLKDGADVTYWIMGRMPADQRVEAHTLVNAGDYSKAFVLCARWGLAGIENGPDFKRTRSGCVSDETIDQILDVGGVALLEEIGSVAFLYNASLTAREKKV